MSRKIDPEQVKSMLEQGMRPGQIAQALGVTASAISKVFQRNKRGVSRDLIPKDIEKVRQKQVSATDTMNRLHRLASEELKHITKLLKTTTDEKERAHLETRQLKYLGTMQNQMELALAVAEKMFSVEEIKAFQDVVLEEISEVAPEVKERIMARLRERRATKNLIKKG